ncbi:hypothetical protein [Haliangium ochraceum]|uniref:Uncharacterized protein n=1 Tax=Haliangium ochraceum (strain DSM 14365 / JCM 11303 / SMP-2) TaxID=502025 RepID=D0LZN0_HALO1|nr:hypothetical protein [Haliangium ochraceum]ACY18009.1 hypothetical protein Hoch_5526 [Haliangium ochraceum DSM 14365]
MSSETKKPTTANKSKLKKRQIARRAAGVAKPATESPLAEVKRAHGSKEALVAALAGSVSKALGADQDETRQRLLGAPNRKLLRLHAAMSELGEKFGGSKDRLVAAVSEARGHRKDEDYATKLQSYSIPRLLDMTRAKSKSAASA